MLKLFLILVSAGVLLGSATPPPPTAEAPSAHPAQIVALTPVAAPAPADAPAVPEAVQTATAPAAQDIEPAAPPAETAPERVAWQESEPAPGPSGVRVVVSIPAQKAFVFEDGELLWSAPVSTGKRGHETPAGTFPILQKKVHHRSSKYDNAPMPYMQRLTWYGIALHAGKVPGYPASHGCIRLPRKYAKQLYDLTDYGTRVTITKAKLRSAEDALDHIG